MNKKIIYFVIIIVVILAAAGLFWRSKYQGLKIQQKTTLPNVERNLTAEQKKIYTDKIAKGEEYLKNLKPQDKNFSQEQLNTYMYLGQLYYGLGDLQKSKEMYELALKNDPKNEQVLVGISSALVEAKDLYGAQAILEKALENSPKNPDVWLRYIQLRNDTGASFGDINQIYTTALEKTERKTDIITSYAQFQEKNNHIAEAISLWQEALKAYPNNAVMYQQEINRLQNLKK